MKPKQLQLALATARSDEERNPSVTNEPKLTELQKNLQHYPFWPSTEYIWRDVVKRRINGKHWGTEYKVRYKRLVEERAKFKVDYYESLRSRSTADDSLLRQEARHS